MTLKFITAAALLACTLSAQASLISDVGALNGAPSVVDFEAYDGFQTSGPEALAADLTFTGDEGSELGAYVRDLGENGAWGVGNHFAAGGVLGQITFTFSGLSSGAGAFVNGYAADTAPLAIRVSAYGSNNLLLEEHLISVDTAYESYNEGQFLGIQRATADIRSLTFTAVGLVADDFAYITPVPEPETWALMLGGLALLGAATRRARRS